MGNNTLISLGEHFEAFVDQRVAAGRYRSASDVVRAGLQLLEEHELKVDALRVALADGERSGPPVPFDIDAFLAGKRQRQPG